MSPETDAPAPSKYVYGKMQPCCWCGRLYTISRSDQLFCRKNCATEYRREYEPKAPKVKPETE
jgi:hypothetical protein